jgi:hypothetical protein
MRHCQFYLIISKKSEEVVSGLKKHSLGDTVLDEARNAEYPPEWANKIMEKF